jgi:DUF2891 family protein
MPDAPTTLTLEQASRFAALALRGIFTEYPNKLDHVIRGPEDLHSPRALHPAFYGCFDWHSAVHSHWMLIRLLKAFPGLPEEREIRDALNTNLSDENLAAELAYLDGPYRHGFERTYGWAWLLKLAAELHAWDDPDAARLSANLRPLAEAFARLYLDFLPRQTYPIRVGTHPNTAFGLALALDYTRTVGDFALDTLIVERAGIYFGPDENYPAAWEPNGNDFLSPSLMEAALMVRVHPEGRFPLWYDGFLPSMPDNLLRPAFVSDRSDGQIVHLDGLNLSRAWCMRDIAAALGPNHPLYPELARAAQVHAEASLPHVASGDYMGEHWLASFAVLMLSSPAPAPGHV